MSIPSEGRHPRADEREDRQLQPAAQPGEEAEEGEAAEHERPAADQDRVGLRSVPVEDLGAGGAAWLDRIQPEHDNVRAALAWGLTEAPELALRLASALRIFWEIRGHFSEGGRWLDEALEARPEAPPAIRAKASAVNGTIAFRRGDLDLSRERFEVPSSSGAGLTTRPGSRRRSATSARSLQRWTTSSWQASCSPRARGASASWTSRGGGHPAASRPQIQRGDLALQPRQLVPLGRRARPGPAAPG
jgi:hypothetical protein